MAAMYAGMAGGMLAMMQGFMPPDAFMFHTSGEIVIQTAIGGAGTLFGPLLGAATWLLLSDFLQTTLSLGATWRLVLGIVFVILVIFFRRGLVGGVIDLYRMLTRGRRAEPGPDPVAVAASPAGPLPTGPSASPGGAGRSGPPKPARSGGKDIQSTSPSTVWKHSTVPVAATSTCSSWTWDCPNWTGSK